MKKAVSLFALLWRSFFFEPQSSRSRQKTFCTTAIFGLMLASLAVTCVVPEAKANLIGPGVGSGLADQSGIDFDGCTAWDRPTPQVTPLGNAGFRLTWGVFINYMSQGDVIVEISGGSRVAEYRRFPVRVWNRYVGYNPAPWPQVLPSAPAASLRFRVAHDRYAQFRYGNPYETYQAVCWSPYSEAFGFSPTPSGTPVCKYNTDDASTNTFLRSGRDRLTRSNLAMASPFVDDDYEGTGKTVSSIFRVPAAELGASIQCGANDDFRNPASMTRSAVEWSSGPAGTDPVCAGELTGVSAARLFRLTGESRGSCWLKIIQAWTFSNVAFDGTLGDNEPEVAELPKNWGTSGVRVFEGNREIPAGALTVSNSQIVIDPTAAGLEVGRGYTFFVVNGASPYYFSEILFLPLEVTVFEDCGIGSLAATGDINYVWYPVDEYTYDDDDCLEQYPLDHPTSPGQPITPRSLTTAEGGTFGLSAKTGGLGRYGVYYANSTGYVLPGWENGRGDIAGQEMKLRSRGLYAGRDDVTPVATPQIGNTYYQRHDFDFGANPKKNALWDVTHVGGVVKVVTEQQLPLTVRMFGPDGNDWVRNGCTDVGNFVVNDTAPSAVDSCHGTTRFKVQRGSGWGAYVASATAVSGGTCTISSGDSNGDTHTGPEGTGYLFTLFTTQTTPGTDQVCDVTFKRAASGRYREISDTVRVTSKHIVPPPTFVNPPIVAPVLERVTGAARGNPTPVNIPALRVMFNALPEGQEFQFGSGDDIDYILEYKAVGDSTWNNLAWALAGSLTHRYCASDVTMNSFVVCSPTGSSEFHGQRRLSADPTSALSHGTTYAFRVGALVRNNSGSINNGFTTAYSNEVEWTANFAPLAPTLRVDSGVSTFHLNWSAASDGAPVGDCRTDSSYTANAKGAWQIQYTTDDYDPGAQAPRNWVTLDGNYRVGGVCLTSTDPSVTRGMDPSVTLGSAASTSYNWSPPDLTAPATYYFRIRGVGVGVGASNTAEFGEWSQEVMSYIVAPEIVRLDSAQRANQQHELEVTVAGTFPTNDPNLNGTRNDGVRQYELSVSNDGGTTWSGELDTETMPGTSTWNCTSPSGPSPNPFTDGSGVYGRIVTGEECTFRIVAMQFPSVGFRGFEIGETYHFRVRAKNEQNLEYRSAVTTSSATSPWSEPVAFTVGREPTLQNIDFTGTPGPCRVTLTWADPTDADSGYVGIASYTVIYRTVDRSTSPPTFGTAVSVDVGKETSHVVTDLTGGQEYYVQLIGSNRYGSSSPWAISTGTVKPDGCSPSGSPTPEKPGEVVQWTEPTTTFGGLDSSTGGCFDAVLDARANVQQRLEGDSVTLDELCDTEMTLEGERGAEDAVGDSSLGTLTFFSDGTGVARGDGFKPGTIAEVWLNSEPRFLGNVTVGSDGSWEKTFDIPAGITAGQHTIMAEGVTTQNDERALYAGVVIVDRGSTTESGVPTSTTRKKRGVVRIAGRRGCVASGTITSRISVRNASVVRFYRDGKLVRKVTLKSNARLRSFVLRTAVPERDYAMHRIVARVTFVDGASPKRKAVAQRFRQCRGSAVTG